MNEGLEQTPTVEAPHGGRWTAEPNLRDYLEMVRRHWRLLVVGALIGAGLGILDYLNTPETYQASTRIQIERRSSNLLGNQTMWLESWWHPEFYPTQREILRSRGLALEVVKYLKPWEHPRLQGWVDPASDLSNDGTENTAQYDAVIERLAGRVRSGLEVREVRGTELFDIIYRDRNPEIAMILANAYAETFIAFGRQSRIDDAEGVSKGIDAEIGRLEAEIADKDKKLQEYSQASDIVETQSDSSVTMQRLESANNAYLQAQNSRIQAQAAYNEILNRPKENIADTLSGGLVSTQRAELISKQRDYQARLETYREDFPAMRELNDEIDQLEQQLDKLVEETARRAINDKRAEYEAARETEQQTLANYRQMETAARRQQSTSTAYRNLLSDIQSDRELLDSLRRSRGQTSMAAKSNEQRSTIHQVDPALMPGGPISPNFRRSIGLGLGLGLLVAGGLVALLEMLDRTIKTPEELEQRFGLPVLSVVPDINAKSPGYGYIGRYGYGYGYGAENTARRRRRDDLSIDRIPFSHPRLAVSEAYRSLRTSLLLSRAGGLQVVVVASATAGEGKTATASNLAVVMAQLGRRTLLVDADLRKARVHTVFKVSNRLGLVSYLVGHTDLDRAFLPTDVENLAVTPAGPSPPNPSELLASKRMGDLVSAARQHFDLVVIDSPPALAVTDATLVADLSDGLVLCVRAGRVTREDVKVCRDRLELSGTKILGAVLNCHRAAKGRYQSSYAYQYGQPQGEKQKQSRAGDAA